MRVVYVSHVAKFVLVGLSFVMLVVLTAKTISSRLNGQKKLVEETSSWVFKSQDGGLELLPVQQVKYEDLNVLAYRSFDESKSPFILPPDKDMTGTVYTKHKPAGSTRYISIGYFDPNKELSFLQKTYFDECEYNKCKMTSDVESADAVIFLVARLTRVGIPTFRRKPGQIWIMKTDEAPSRFTWFESLNRTGLKEHFNWTLTHKLDSDIPFVYGRLIRQNLTEPKDYDKIYQGKNRTAAWFVSHCKVRSDRMIYVERMQSRTDVDIFGLCGPYTCGMAEKVPGVQTMRKQADQLQCFPLLSQSYKFYLAFENSLCQEYISEKFFKMFNNVDVVPVVRGGADYKRYFPSDMYVDAADFSTPEALADYLDDLGNDKERYISYLKNKDRYRSVLEFPDWQCRLCEKLHTDHSIHTYSNVYEWWVKDSCHDPVDSQQMFW
ncbi:alpha-(1,3)-fucosyltransferase C-like [Biomphalaria glabrata]|uniref:Fucosyltransferase n=1 Tax=Biomphalaria glabrata TaxID=6526 RepID=A0A9W2Z848_BIOGL|nr:alpha-(1,3)-fucosyltransferase C-like [Biomphalaria glabrata]